MDLGDFGRIRCVRVNGFAAHPDGLGIIESFYPSVWFRRSVRAVRVVRVGQLNRKKTIEVGSR